LITAQAAIRGGSPQENVVDDKEPAKKARAEEEPAVKKAGWADGPRRRPHPPAQQPKQ